jgi:hypothetical protein
MHRAETGKEFHMKAIGVSLLAAAALAGAGAVYDKNDTAAAAVGKGARWLASVQGHDGGWGQDGGETSYVRTGERLETQGNDVANTAVAVQALVRAGSTATQGPYRDNVRRGVEFLLRNVEASPEEGLGVTSVNGTQIQRKLGPFIDTFLTSQLLAELDGGMGDAASNVRVRRALEKCVRKIERNQQGDGSWNISGGWAPILGTSIASRSLDSARRKGVEVRRDVLAKVDAYTQKSAEAAAKPASPAAGGRSGYAADAASAGVPLYNRAQVMEQLSRTEADRVKNAPVLREMARQMKDERMVAGFGSMGGEEFFSYLNVSDSLRRTGGAEWQEWNGKIKTRLVSLQNNDGTWAGHHCITGRVAVTSAAILTLYAERAPLARN